MTNNRLSLIFGACLFLVQPFYCASGAQNGSDVRTFDRVKLDKAIEIVRKGKSNDYSDDEIEENRQMIVRQLAYAAEKKVELTGLDFTGAFLGDLELGNLSIPNVNFANVTFSSINFTSFFNNNLEKADFTNATCRGDVTFWYTNLAGANFAHTEFSSAYYTDVNLSGAKFTNAWLFDHSFYDCNVQKADFTRANLRQATLWRVNFFESNLTFADLRGAKFRDTNFSYACLVGAKFDRNAPFDNMILTGAIMTERQVAEYNLDAERLGINTLPANLDTLLDCEEIYPNGVWCPPEIRQIVLDYLIGMTREDYHQATQARNFLEEESPPPSDEQSSGSNKEKTGRLYAPVVIGTLLFLLTIEWLLKTRLPSKRLSRKKNSLPKRKRQKNRKVNKIVGTRSRAKRKVNATSMRKAG